MFMYVPVKKYYLVSLGALVSLQINRKQKKKELIGCNIIHCEWYDKS